MIDLVEQLIPEAVRQQSAYHVPPADGLIKLDAMENPWPLPEEIKQGWLDRLADAEFNRYPDPAAKKLCSAIRQVFEVDDSLGLVLGNGSDELIQMLAQLVGGAGRTFMAPSPSFSMYELISAFTGTAFDGVALDARFEPDTDQFLARIAASSPACVFLAYPNNPTGNRFDNGFIEAVLNAAPGLVVVDEAYFAFSGKTWLHAINDHPNLLVMRTLSKSGLAGLRLGMLFGARDWTDEIDKIRLPYNINVLSQLSGLYCLEHHAALERQTRQIVASRSQMAERLGSIPGVEVFPSETNFILIRLGRDADAVWQALRDRGVLVRQFGRSDPALTNCLRLTVGTGDEIDALIDNLTQVLVD